MKRTRDQIRREIEQDLRSTSKPKKIKLESISTMPAVELIESIQKVKPKIRKGAFDLHTCALFCGACNSGKTNACINLLKLYQDDGSFNRFILISPTYENNRESWHTLNLRKEDIYYEGILTHGLEVVKMIEQKIRKIARDYKDYLEYVEAYQAFLDGVATMRQQMLVRNRHFEKPEYQPFPSIAVILDDLSHSKVYSISRDNPFVNLLLRHRHVFDIGVSFYLITQNFNSGAPKILRQNLKQFHLYKTHDQTQLKSIYEQVAQGCTREEFDEAFAIATDKKHDFLTVDLGAKEGEPIFRKNFDQYIILGNQQNGAEPS